MAILRTEIKERPVRLALVILLMSAVSLLAPSSERVDSERAVATQGEDTNQIMLLTHGLDACSENRSIDDAKNVSVGDCIEPRNAQSSP